MEKEGVCVCVLESGRGQDAATVAVELQGRRDESDRKGERQTVSVSNSVTRDRRIVREEEEASWTCESSKAEEHTSYTQATHNY